MSSTHWPVARHQPLTLIADDLWMVDAELNALPIGRRMVIARHRDASLTIHSAVCCDDATMRAIDALGRVARIIVPSPIHRLDGPHWKAREPDARVLATKATAKRVAQRVAVDGDYSELADDPRFSAIALDGVPTEGVFIHVDDRGARTLVFNDALQNNPDRIAQPRGWMLRLMGSTGGPKVTPIVRLFVIKDKAAYASHLRRLAKLPGVVRAIPAHGAIIENAPTSTASATLIRVADRLSPPSR